MTARADDLHVVDKDALRKLLGEETSTALSFYFPTNRAAVEPAENSLHLKSMLSRAEDALDARGVARPNVCELLRPLKELIDDADFWLHQWEGLALLRTDSHTTVVRLPYSVAERCVVGGELHVKPLFPAMFPDSHYFVLALSQHTVRLLHCTRHGARAVDLEPLGIPRSLEEALRYDDLQKPELQHHPTTGPGRVPVGQAAADGRSGGNRQHGFHGHGESGEGTKTQIRRYLHAVDAGLSKLLGAQSAPMIVAAVDYVRAIWRDVSRYRNILDAGVDGSPDRSSDAQLHEAASPIIERHVREELRSARDRLAQHHAQGLGSTSLENVLEAAHAGRVDTLFVARDVDLWGSYDFASQTLERHEEPGPDGVELLDLAARWTFVNSGTVYVCGANEMAGDAPLAASFRY
ncbi:MAG TPA: hypothetical protein VHK89_05065 [Actinomycetota bacterium]|nr:hypothetical protein [Actinomycetota bacterium]